MSILFIDTETTGIPKEHWKNWDECYAVQISYVITDQDYKQLDAKNYLIKDTLHKSSAESLNIHHITEEERNAKGILINRFFMLFKQDLEQYEVKNIVAHGIYFDIGLIFNEATRNGLEIDTFADYNYYCSKRSPLYVKTKGLKGTVEKYKLPILYNGHAHDALYDAYLCLSLFSYTKDKEVMQIKYKDIINTVFTS